MMEIIPWVDSEEDRGLIPFRNSSGWMKRVDLEISRHI